MAFTKDDLASAFRELGDLAATAGKVIDLAVYGGSALMLVSNFRDSSWDIDAVASPDQNFIRELAQTVAEKRGWPADWLNDGVRTYLSPLAEDEGAHELFATYPDESRPGLRVYVPTAEYMLAMKLMAMRIEPAGGKDLDDILNLMEVVGLTGKSDIVEVAAKFYPEAKISGKLRLALDYVWQAYHAKRARRQHEPPRYLGRSGDSTEG
jgi:hypothetical protein